MLFYTHLLLGISFFILFNSFFSGGNKFAFLILVLLGSVLPDIDEKHSRIKNWTGLLGIITSRLAKHRGIFHSLPFALLLFIVVALIFNGYYSVGLFIGYFSHLVGDMLTLHGVTLFYPFSRFKIKGPIRVGSASEYLILAGLVLLILKEFV
jgi:inner membrane protein